MLWLAQFDQDVAAEKIEVSDLVLVRNDIRRIDMSSARKLEYRWEGPHRVKATGDKGAYFLETLDGIPLEGSFASDRVKRFVRIDDTWVEPDGVLFYQLPKKAPSAERFH
ncbi:hypothetical protein VTH82DRAFT_4710 [Thermothelomyces myriococcoides]